MFYAEKLQRTSKLKYNILYYQGPSRRVGFSPILQEGIMSNIGSFIRDLRKERGLSQKALAQISEVSIAVVGRIENGDMKINVQSLNKILNVFGYQVGGQKIHNADEKYLKPDQYDFFENE